MQSKSMIKIDKNCIIQEYAEYAQQNENFVLQDCVAVNVSILFHNEYNL